VHKNFVKFSCEVLTERRYASTVFAVVMCPSVYPSICLSVIRRYCLKTTINVDVESRKQRHTIAQESSFLKPKVSVKFERGHPNRSAKCRWNRL